VPTTERRLRAFCDEQGVVPVVRAGQPLGYRVRSRLMVRRVRGAVRTGLFREGTHDVVDIPNCGVHHPLINRAALALRRAMAETGTSAYSEVDHQGLVRALQVVVERATARVQLVLVLNAAEFDAARPLVAALISELGSDLQGLYLNAHPELGNAILGRDFLHCAGEVATRETLGGAQVFFPPGAFGQANLGLFECILEDLHAEVPIGARITEFHAGTGAIGLGLVEQSRAYVFNELGEHSLAGLGLGIDALSEASRAKARVAAGKAASHADLCGSADVVIVDPPRKGLEPALLDALAEDTGPSALHYLSCDFDSLLRDCRVLLRKYRISRISAYALFPFTPHLETLVRFERAS
jgi:23S rRNA (uracil1939-C5)-methyltransferase